MSKHHTKNSAFPKVPFMDQWRELVNNVLPCQWSTVDILYLCRKLLATPGDIPAKLQALEELDSEGVGVISRVFVTEYGDGSLLQKGLLEAFDAYNRSVVSTLTGKESSLMHRTMQEQFVEGQERICQGVIAFEFSGYTQTVMLDFASGIVNIYLAYRELYFLSVYAVSTRSYGHSHPSYTWLEDDLITRFEKATGMGEVPRTIITGGDAGPIDIVGYTGFSQALFQIKSLLDGFTNDQEYRGTIKSVESKVGEMLNRIGFQGLDLGRERSVYLREELLKAASALQRVVASGMLVGYEISELKGDIASGVDLLREKHKARALQN